MKTRRWRNLIILSLLLLLGMIYGAHVLMHYHQPAKQTQIAQNADDNAEGSEENLKETSHHLFLHDKWLFHLNPGFAITQDGGVYIQIALPETCLQLNTPPPDCV
jgi:CHASE1-domain containing sensor protein